jgi:hypothetical protein
MILEIRTHSTPQAFLINGIESSAIIVTSRLGKSWFKGAINSKSTQAKLESRKRNLATIYWTLLTKGEGFEHKCRGCCKIEKIELENKSTSRPHKPHAKA